MLSLNWECKLFLDITFGLLSTHNVGINFSDVCLFVLLFALTRVGFTLPRVINEVAIVKISPSQSFCRSANTSRLNILSRVRIRSSQGNSNNGSKWR